MEQVTGTPLSLPQLDSPKPKRWEVQEPPSYILVQAPGTSSLGRRGLLPSLGSGPAGTGEGEACYLPCLALGQGWWATLYLLTTPGYRNIPLHSPKAVTLFLSSAFGGAGLSFHNERVGLKYNTPWDTTLQPASYSGCA